MCGIAGYLGSFGPELLARMSRAIAHRGPDDHGSWYDPAARVGLAHRRLSIIDLRPEGRQPMTNEDGTLQITFNGEIYNFKELRERLLTRGHVFKSRSDTEVLLHLYEEEGPDFLKALNGIFAFALWDGRRRQLLLARDGFGVKPLYYAELPRGVLFGSELKALLECPELPREIDAEALHAYLAYLWAPAPHTMLRAVRKLPAGRAMLLRDQRIEQEWTFYDLPYDGRRRQGEAAELALELRAHLETAVERQMVSDVPVGAFLSGGLDSSSVVAAMRRAGAGPDLPCYSIGFGDDDFDGNPGDLPYARRVAAHLGVDLREIRVGPEIIDDLERMLYQLDEPQADPAPINVLLIAEQARRDGIKVLLSGAGGDDIFSGYRRHHALLLERYWSWLPPTLRAPLAAWARHAGAEPAWRRKLAKLLLNAEAPPEQRLCRAFEWSPDPLRRGLYASDLRAELAAIETSAPLVRTLARIPDEPDRLNRMLYLEGKHFLADHNLNYTDKMGMAAGIEIRVPLLDPDLVAFAVGLPPELKQKGSVGKMLFKQAMTPVLPPDVVHRPKTGFGLPVRRWLRGELAGWVEELLSPRALATRGWFEPAAVQTLLRLNQAGRVDASYTIFSLLCLEIWARLFLDGAGRQNQPVGHDARPTVAG
jgi:asparagine synthase (glutamine-hydrolysing)